MSKKSFAAQITALILRFKFKRPRSASVAKLTKQFEKQKIRGEQPYAIPKKIKFHCNVCKSVFRGMDIYTLTGSATTDLTVLYFSGSGYVHGPMKYHWIMCDRIAKQCNAKIILPIYPLAPFHSYRDLYEVMVPMYNKYVADHPDERIIFMGDSAGGGLALAFYEYAIERGLRLPEKVVAVSPWVDIATDNSDIKKLARKDPMIVQHCAQLWGRLWADGGDVSDFMLSPIHYANTEKLTNVHIIAGTDGILFPDIKLFFDKIKNNPGCTFTVGPHMNHDYPLYPSVIPEVRKEQKHIMDLITH